MHQFPFLPQALNKPSLLSRVSVIAEVWKPMLRINEHLKVQIDTNLHDDDGEIECATFPASATAEDVGLWDFVLAVHPRCEAKNDQDLERVVVHELVHLLMEPLRAEYFVLREANVTVWETVIQRIADSYIHLVDR